MVEASLKILRRPHLMLPHFRGEIAIHAFRQFIQPLQGILRLDSLALLLELQAVF